MGAWLESLVPWGTDVIAWAQSHSPAWLDAIFRIFTSLGYEEIYLILLPLVYWCIHKQMGVALSYISLATAWANSLLKNIFQIPRPADPPVEMRAPRPETSPSFPSGHAQNAVVNWGYLAYRLRGWLVWAVASVLMVGIGLSRIVLGVHFPQDVIGGWLIGLVLLVGYAWVAPGVGRWLERQRTEAQVSLAIVVPVALMFLSPADAEGLYPSEGVVTPLAALAGLGIGLIMERSLVRFSVGGLWWRRLLRFLVGMVVAGIFYAGPKLLVPGEADMAYGLEVTVRFVRYALVGWVVAFLCPWLFMRLGLADRADEPPA
jgi:membrane-associated phospholipid phosphatase